ncbi:hypothetical protein BS47DRAFT_748647 [Hydnum rufescens UP504]|uniref:Uncharacterized protein n=1 Tax=Hydnum rufescens UP504 TaxID=1448309 RepID=A0A9P6DZ83_9AGAM|nr:hypothetical protein BS47DRAFT_748647 [Hydnum rufescens UP504]
MHSRHALYGRPDHRIYLALGRSPRIPTAPMQHARSRLRTRRRKHLLLPPISPTQQPHPHDRIHAQRPGPWPKSSHPLHSRPHSPLLLFIIPLLSSSRKEHAPSIHCSAWTDCANFGADFFLPEKMPPVSRISTFGLGSYTRHHVSMLIATHGSTTPLVLTRPGSEDEKGDMVTVKMGVHDPDLENIMWLSGRLAWDEVSGRLCVPSRDSDSVVVLEY